ncbi:transcriptional regulator, RpiR family [Amphibacillus marinus]|uniref:Transcriptional regulator, RpiR family n=1 Tax=Amphibacillus marinus TaxID=872970 RepID=A0A1H8MKY7_9BACI|nr:MurR/RpiR family transcriptional regulator [Amphibacillus marinus]SEO18045.1 transcriptional regulator, RpiR family [Amphibacillus marinus]
MFISEQIASFSDLDHKLYSYIIRHLDQAIYMRIRDLAAATGVSTTTILRFCKKVGCDGFAEFKIKLKLYKKEQDADNDGHVIAGEKSLTEFLERTLTRDFEEEIINIAKVIANSKRLVFTGVGSSGILAEYGSRYFSGLKKFAFYLKDPFLPIHEQYIEDSVTIVLSVSGESQATLSQVHQFKQKGSVIVSITNDANSSVAKVSDYNLAYYASTEFIGNTNLTTQLPVIYLIERLAKATYFELQKT